MNIVQDKGLEQVYKGMKITPLTFEDFVPGSCLRNLQNRPGQKWMVVVAVNDIDITLWNGSCFPYQALADSLYEYWTPVTKAWLPCTKEATLQRLMHNVMILEAPIPSTPLIEL